MSEALNCRMYEKEYPDVDDLLMVKVTSIQDLGAYASLLEYNNMEGLFLLSEYGRRRIGTTHRMFRAGKQEVAIVIRVDKEKGYIDLSKRRVSLEERAMCEARYKKSKTVHKIMRAVAEECNKNLEELYAQIAWPLYRKFGHAFDAFKTVFVDPETVFADIQFDDPEVHGCLLQNIYDKMKLQPARTQAEFELTCFTRDGIDAIKAALKAGEACGSELAPIKIMLAESPLYIVRTVSLHAQIGIDSLTKALNAITDKITAFGGEINVKVNPHVVTQDDDNALTRMMVQRTQIGRAIFDYDDVESDDEN